MIGLIIAIVAVIVVATLFSKKKEPLYCPQPSHVCKSTPKWLDGSCACGRSNKELRNRGGI